MRLLMISNQPTFDGNAGFCETFEGWCGLAS